MADDYIFANTGKTVLEGVYGEFRYCSSTQVVQLGDGLVADGS
jgi:hypothetical protein